MRPCETSVCTRSAIRSKAAGGSRSRSTCSCGSTVAGSNTRPETEISIEIAGNNASVAQKAQPAALSDTRSEIISFQVRRSTCLVPRQGISAG